MTPVGARGSLAALPPVLLGLVASGVALLETQTPVVAILRYAAYLGFAVLVPGTLVHRALRGRSPLLLADLALGAATGLALELAAWAVFTGLRLQQVLWLWPLLVIGPFLAVRPLRRHWRRIGPDTVAERSTITTWLVTAAFCWLSLTSAVLSWRIQPLPPRASLSYGDLYWHLSVAAELTRTVRPEVPQVAGRPLLYHWFSSAHLAAGHEISGVDLPTIGMRLWLIPVALVIVGLLVSIARRLTGSAWPGGLAAVLLLAPAMVTPWPWLKLFASGAIASGSPSLVFGMVFLLLATDVLIDLVRGHAIGRGWFVLLLAIAAAPGSKPAVLPVLLAGLLLTGSFRLLHRRPVGPLVLAILAMALAVLAAGPVTGRDSAGSGLKLFGIVTFLAPWGRYTGSHLLAGTGGHVIEGIGTAGALALLVLLLAATLLQYAVVLAALPLLRHATRSDPALWFLVGGVLAGLGGLLVVDHPNAGEIYLGKTATPLALLLAVWGIAVAARLPMSLSSPPPRSSPPAAAWAVGALAGVGLAVLAGALAPTPAHVRDYPAALAVPVLVLLGGAAGGALGWRLARRTPWGSPRIPRGAGTAACCAALLGGVLVSPTQLTVRETRAAARHLTPSLSSPSAVTAAEAQAARWMAHRVPTSDVIATNVHCTTRPTRPHCDERAFWVAGLGEHRVLVESWAYTEEALGRQGRDGMSFEVQPFDDPVLFQDNENAFTAPTPASLAALYRDRSVRWLFADRLAGRVSPALARLATLRLRTADVSIYQLRAL